MRVTVCVCVCVWRSPYLTAAPSKPTTPQLEDRSVQTLTLSFSVKFGSASINYYLLRIYDTSDLTDTTNTTLTRVDREVNITAGDVEYVRGEEGRVEGGELVGYEVTVRVTGLSQGEEYVFSVAAASDVGVSDFSDLSDPFSLEDGMLCGVLCDSTHFLPLPLSVLWPYMSQILIMMHSISSFILACIFFFHHPSIFISQGRCCICWCLEWLLGWL